MTNLRSTLFDYMDITTRSQYLAHREDFVKNVNRWKLTDESRALFARAKEIVWDVETIPKPPVGTYQHLTDGVRKNLGLTYLTEVTHIAFFAIVDGQEVLVVMVAPFTEDELDFARQCMAQEGTLHIGHNQAFDIRIFCGHHDLPVPKQTYCTLVGQTTMMGGPKGGYPDGSTRGLESLLYMYDVQQKVFDVDPRVTSEWLSFMKDNRNTLHTLPAEDVAVYVVTDVVATYWVYRAQMYWSKVLQGEYGYTALWERHEEDQQYQNILNRWSVRGMPVNREWMKRQLEAIEQEKLRWIPYFVARGCGDLTKAKQKFRFIFDVCQSPTPDSWEYVEFSSGHGKWYPAEMQNSLWTDAAFTSDTAIAKKGWDSSKDYSKWYATGSDAVDYYIKFGPEEHRSKLRLYKYYTSMLSMEATYREWLDHSSYDGKVHPLLTMTANSGRTIGDTPNPLNVPMHKPHVVKVFDPATGGEAEVTEFTGRGMFAPHPGKVLLEFDASNAEVRFAAVVAQAEGLARAFAEKRDLHRENAAAFYRVPVDDVIKDQRTNGKPIFFAMQYGGGARTISGRVHYPVKQVEDMINGWNETNWEVGKARKRIEEEGQRFLNRMQAFPIKAARQAYTVLYNGRWVPAPTVWSRPKLYALWNSQQQGGVGGLVEKAIIETDKMLQEHPELESDMYIMYHDSIIAEVPEDNEEAARTVGEYIAMQLMTQVPLELTVVNGIPVPWPSGCDLYENQFKWGWRPDADFPYYCGEDEGEVVISFPEDAAWDIMKDKALKRIKAELREVQRDIEQHYATPPVERFVWHDEEEDTDTCLYWQDIVQYPPAAHYEQSRYWGRILQMHHGDLPDTAKDIVQRYRAWVFKLEALDQRYSEVRQRYEQTKEFRATASGRDG